MVKEISTNLLTWFDIGGIGVYITPELICGRSCILLLDTTAIFSTHPLLKGRLEENDFQVVRFEFDTSHNQHLYLLFTDNIDSNFFVKDLCIPKDKISSYTASLFDIQSVFYEHAKTLYGFRIDVLVRSSTFLGLNHLGNEVYTSNFGRFKISYAGYDGEEKLFRSERPDEINIGFLRANSLEDVFFCSEGFVLDAIKTRRNVTLSDVIRFAAILYQDKNNAIDTSKVRLYQILSILNVFSAIYIKNIISASDTVIKGDGFFDDKVHYKNVCLNSEACPSPPRAIYTDYLASQYSTPAPLSFVMQKLLIHGDSGSEMTVLDPMFGHGSLITVLSRKGYLVVGLEKNPNKYKLGVECKYPDTQIVCVDSLNKKITDHMPKGELFNYVICNPACLSNERKYEYKDSIGSIVVERTDFISLLRTLTIREDKGRSVFLLPYFTSDDVTFAVNQVNELDDIINFIYARYHIEGCVAISNEIYSKSLGKISPILLIIGSKRSSPEKNKIRFVKEALDSTIHDYDELWDWTNSICYKRSKDYQNDLELFEETQKIFSESFNEFESQLEPEIIVPVADGEIDFDNDQPPIVLEQKSFGISYSAADSMFQSVVGGTPEETPQSDNSNTEKSEPESPVTGTPEEQDKVNADTAQTDSENDEVSTTTLALDKPVDENVNADAVEGDGPVTEPTKTESNTESTNDQEVADKTPEVPVSEDAEQTTTNAENTPSLVKEPVPDTPNQETSIARSKDILKKTNSANKIAKTSGNFFDIEQKNKIIRYHSLATLSDPSSNVYLNEFKSYLHAKSGLHQAIAESYNEFEIGGKDILRQQFRKKLEKYLEEFEINISLEAFLGAHLELGDPKSFVNYFKSEHLDFIAATIIKFTENKSIFLADSLGMETDVPLAALIHFYRLNNRGVVYLAKDENSIDSLVDTFNQLNDSLFKAEPIEFLIAHRYSDVEKVVSKFRKGKVLILLDEPKFITKLRIKNLANALNDINSFACIFDTDLGQTKHSAAIITQALRAHTIFRASKWISPETNLSVLSGLFTKKVNERYFQSMAGGMDDMSSHLLKLNLIENFSLFERFEDLSNIRLQSNTQDLWKGNYNVLTQSYSKVINNIVILAEEIHRSIVDKRDYHQKLSMVRSIAMKIYELCTFCISTIPLTHSIFSSIKKQNKPIVVIPENIESVLFNLLENLQVELLGDFSKFKISTLTQLNQLIDMKLREYDEKITVIDANEQDSAIDSLKGDIDELIYIRSLSVNTYLTSAKTGTISKYPDVTNLISAFYKNCTLDLEDNVDNYSEILKVAKKIEAEIETLADLPLCIADFLKYELSQYRIKTAEISSRSFSICYDEDKALWKPSDVSPVSNKLGKQAIVDDFNTGEVDLLIVEAKEVLGFDLSSVKRKSGQFTDYMRKRVLFVTYFNQPIEHYLRLIHSINSFEQFVSPEISLEIPDNPVQKALAELLMKQLGKFNVYGVGSNLVKPDLSFYLTESGQALLVEYLSLNPSYQAHHPALPIRKWTIFNVLNIANMIDTNMQDEIVEHLAYLSKQHFEYLRDIKCNPFDLFIVSPKARYSRKEIDSEVMYLNKELSSSDAPFNGSIDVVTLEYVKNTSNSFNLEDCKALYKSQSELEISRLKSLIAKFNELSGSKFKFENATHSELLGAYIENYTNYLISVYQDKVFNLLSDRYGNWIFKERICSLTYLKTHFIGKNGIKISDTLDGLYSEICMLGDSELLSTFEKSCEIATFLQCYQLAVKKQEKDGHNQPILISVPSPFNDKLHTIQEGFLMKINLPSSIMLSLTPKAFTVSMAYPNKSKVVDLSLAYVLENPDVLKGQHVLPKLSKSKIEIILKSYHKSKYKDLLAKKLTECEYKKVLPFTGLPYLGSSAHHATIREFSKEKIPTKIRTMDVLVGNLFEIYFMIHNKYSLTMVSFINSKGLTQHGFVIPSDVNIGDVVTCLIRRTSIHNIGSIYNFFSKHYMAFSSLRSIQWFGNCGIVEATKINSENIELSFIGEEHEIQKILLDEDVFKEYPVMVSYDSEANIIDEPVANKKEKYKFKPLDLLDANIYQLGKKFTYKFKLSSQQLIDFIALVNKKRLFNGVLVDCNSQNDRISLKKVINS